MSQLCILCQKLLNSNTCAVVRMPCDHIMHDECRMQLFVCHRVQVCPVCFPTLVQQALAKEELPLDFGDDASVRTIVMNTNISPQAYDTRVTFAPPQSYVVPTDDTISSVSAEMLQQGGGSVSTSSSGGSAASGGGIMGTLRRAVKTRPDNSFTSDNQSELLMQMLRRKATTDELSDRGFNIDAVCSGGVDWTCWESLGYGVRDAVCLGARWMNLVRMGFGHTLRDSGDYELLSQPPLSVPFAMIFSTLWNCNWQLLADQHPSAKVLGKLGMKLADARQYLSLTAEDLVLLNYIPLHDYAQHLGLTTAYFQSWNPPEVLLARMQWSEKQLELVLGIRVRRAHVPSSAVMRGGHGRCAPPPSAPVGGPPYRPPQQYRGAPIPPPY